MNTRQDALTQGIVSEFTQDTTNNSLSCNAIFYSDDSARILLSYSERYVNVFGKFPGTVRSHVTGDQHLTRETADKFKKPSRFAEKALYRIVVKAKRP